MSDARMTPRGPAPADGTSADRDEVDLDALGFQAEVRPLVSYYAAKGDCTVDPLDQAFLAGIYELVAERDRYRKALEKIADPGCNGSSMTNGPCACDSCIAEAALEKIGALSRSSVAPEEGDTIRVCGQCRHWRRGPGDPPGNRLGTCGCVKGPVWVWDALDLPPAGEGGRPCIAERCFFTDPRADRCAEFDRVSENGDGD